MDVLDLSVQKKNIEVPPGTVLTLQGKEDKALVFLNSGMAEILSSPSYIAGDTKDEVLLSSFRVGLIKGESIVGLLGLLKREPFSFSIRMLTKGIVNIFPLESDKIFPTLQANFPLNHKVLSALVRRIESARLLNRNYKYLWHKLANIADSLALTVPQDLHEVIPNDDRGKAKFSEYRAFMQSRLDEKKLALPNHWDPNILLGELQQKLDLYEEEDKKDIDTIIDLPQYLFMKRLVEKPRDLLQKLFSADEPSNFYIIQILSRTMEQLLECNKTLVSTIKDLAENLYGTDGWIAQVIGKISMDKGQIHNYLHFLGRFCARSYSDAYKLIGLDFKTLYPVYSRLQGFHYIEEQKQTSMKTGAPSKESIKQKYRNLTKRILEFAEMGSTFDGKLLHAISAFKQLPDKLKLDEKGQELKIELSALYWKLYEKCMLKVIDTDLKGFIPGIMLHCGLIDETLVAPEDLELIDAMYGSILSITDKTKVMTLPYFLDLIFQGKVNPSIRMDGQGFHELLRKQEKRRPSKKGHQEPEIADTPEDRVRFEIRQVAAEVAELLFGRKKFAFPFIHSSLYGDALSTWLMSPEKAAEMIQTVTTRDWSVFFRETVCHHKFGTDIVMEEIPPIFVIYPAMGPNAYMWQELDGRKRNTTGRFFMPLVLTENHVDTLTKQIAFFRWELGKTIAGAKWMDPVDGGVTGAYFDYISFYKKNRDLTPETKEKIARQIKRTRSDRDRFAEDYKTWFQNEFEGQIRFNTAVRQVFYQYCPFPLPIRQTIAKSPIYSDLERRLNHKRHQEEIKLATRLKKFEKNGVPPPQELQDYEKFLKS